MSHVGLAVVLCLCATMVVTVVTYPVADPGHSVFCPWCDNSLSIDIGIGDFTVVDFSIGD